MGLKVFDVVKRGYLKPTELLKRVTSSLLPVLFCVNERTFSAYIKRHFVRKIVKSDSIFPNNSIKGDIW